MKFKYCKRIISSLFLQSVGSVTNNLIINWNKSK